MKMKLSQKILAGFIACRDILIAVGYFSIRNSEKLLASNQSVNHTHVVLNEFGKILSGTIDEQTGVMGYVLTGNQKF